MLHSVPITVCATEIREQRTEFTVTGISDESNSLARRPHLTSSIASTFDAHKRDLASVMVWLTEEKSHSDCAKLADVQRRRPATGWDTHSTAPSSAAVDFYLQLEYAMPCVGPAPP